MFGFYADTQKATTPRRLSPGLPVRPNQLDQDQFITYLSKGSAIVFWCATCGTL